jgi:lysophospholipase L1-like esterase
MIWDWVVTTSFRDDWKSRESAVTDIRKSVQSFGQPAILYSMLLLLASLLFALLAAELLLRLKNNAMTNYDIEMWRYAKELKKASPDPALDFDHVPSRDAILQNVDIRLNEWGLRGGPVQPLQEGKRRILFLGGSITLGWGVPEEATVEAQLENLLRAARTNAQVLNGGVGNYNTERYVTRFFTELVDLKPTDIVVNYFLRDAEALPPGGGNWFLRNSELAVTLWIAYHRVADQQGDQALVDHYREVYRNDSPGYVRMESRLTDLSNYAHAHGIRLYLAMVPDIHNLVDYKLGFVHEIMKDFSRTHGYIYIDLLPALQGRPPEGLWAMPGDPHPNALGHRLMAEAIAPVIASVGGQNR